MRDTTSFETTSDIASDWTRAFAERRASAFAAALQTCRSRSGDFERTDFWTRERSASSWRLQARSTNTWSLQPKQQMDIGNMSSGQRLHSTGSSLLA